MDLYLYRLWDFDFGDEEDDPENHITAKIIETKLQNVLPMAYGYFVIGLNAIDIYPYHFTTVPSHPIMIFQDKEMEANDAYSIVIPYQNKQLAKDIFSRWLETLGYKKAAREVAENRVGTLCRMALASVTKKDLAYAKRWDVFKTKKRIEKICNV